MPEQQDSYSRLSSLDEVLAKHERDLFAFQGLTGPEQARFQLRERARYARDPWSFLTDCTFTLDQVSHDAPIKPFPVQLEYLEYLTALWNAEKLLAIPKSRRMTCSWLFISLFTHDTLFNPGRFNGFVSKKEDDSSELVARAEFICEHIPEWRIPRALLPAIKNGRMSKQPPLLEFPDINSKIQGFPMGADQLRQFTFSGLLFDEWAFWEGAQKAYSSAKPTLDGGGRLVGISSRSPGFFKKIVFDQLDALDLSFREIPPVAAKRPIEGVEVWRNPKNRFVCVDLHYTANPAKRGDAWKNAVKQSMPRRDFEMEYEKSWSTFEGQPVYGDFNKTLHVSQSTLKPEPGIPLLMGWDFGLCYDDKTEVLTESGWKLFKDVELSERVAALDPITMEMKHEFPKLKIDKDYDGDLYCTDNNSISFAVTPDHTIPYWSEAGVFKKSFAKDILESPGHNKVRMTCKWSGEVGSNEFGLDQNLFAAFMGAFLSEGCVDLKSNRVTIYQVKEKSWLREILMSTPWKWTEDEACFRCSDKQLALYLRPFGHAKHKYVPAEIKQSTPDIISEFVRAYTLGDGHIRTRPNGVVEHTLFTTSKRMAADMQELALKMSWTSSCRTVKPQTSYYASEQRWITNTGGYCVTFKKTTDWSELRSHTYKKVSYTGRVYCLSVSTGILCVRRNGRTHFNGNTPACILAQLVGKQLRIYKEFIETNGSISKLAPLVQSHLQLNYQNWMHDGKLFSFIDPAGLQRKDTDESTCAGVLRKLGFQDIRPGPVNWEPRRKAVDDFLTKTYGDGPAFLIDEGGCPILIEGFAGGYRYPEKALEVEPTSIRPVKDKYSHPHDALQYLCAGATQLRKAYNIDLPPPAYGFQAG